MTFAQSLTPCLWFDHQAEEAARFYVGIFKDSRILDIARYGEAGKEIHGRPPGSVMTVAFELMGQGFTALNGGPVFRFNEAVSLQVYCETQEELDEIWTKLSAGGDPKAQQCGWLKDKYGLSWQVMPRKLLELLQGAPTERSERVMQAVMGMQKLDFAELERAARGEPARR